MTKKTINISKFYFNLKLFLKSQYHLLPCLLDRIKYYDSYLSKCEQFLSNKSIPFLQLNYEDHIENDPNIASKLIFDFVGVEYSQSKINYVKTNPYKIQDILSNYEEVRDYLKGTQFEWMVYN
ncbi:MAG: hypothetical protein MGF17_02735 [Trichodesmium sp. MAG_R04]|nr:hypothetical protein [Trichodesmium sp. MAG_R04]